VQCAAAGQALPEAIAAAAVQQAIARAALAALQGSTPSKDELIQTVSSCTSEQQSSQQSSQQISQQVRCESHRELVLPEGVVDTEGLPRSVDDGDCVSRQDGWDTRGSPVPASSSSSSRGRSSKLDLEMHRTNRTMYT
jgi:hypothetical protein